MRVWARARARAGAEPEYIMVSTEYIMARSTFHFFRRCRNKTWKTKHRLATMSSETVLNFSHFTHSHSSDKKYEACIKVFRMAFETSKNRVPAQPGSYSPSQNAVQRLSAYLRQSTLSVEISWEEQIASPWRNTIRSDSRVYKILPPSR